MKLKQGGGSGFTRAVQSADEKHALFGRSPDFKPMFEVDLDRLHARGDQPRRHFDEAELQALAESIRARGVLQPILVRRHPQSDTDFEIVAGERRFRASKLAGRDRIRAVLVEGDPAEIALIENIQRVDLSAYEEAAGISALMERGGYSQERVAEILGKSRVRVNETLRILTLPEEMLAALRAGEGRVPRSTLLQIARVQDLRQQQALWQQALGGAGEKAVRAARRATSPPGPSVKSILRVADTARVLAATPPALSSAEREKLVELRAAIDRLLGG